MTGQDDDAEFRGWLTRQMVDPDVTSADELAVYRDVFTDGQIRAAEWRAQDAPARPARGSGSRYAVAIQDGDERASPSGSSGRAGAISTYSGRARRR